MRKLQKNIKGFTMVEMIITLFIGSILLAWGIPNYRDLKIRRQVTDSVNEMSYSLSLARAEAIRYGQTVTVTPIGGDWNNGWLITTPGVNGNPDIEIYQKEPLNSLLSVSQNGSLQGAIQFSNIGSLVGNNVGLFTLSHTAASEARNVSVSLSGSVKVTHP